MARSVAKTACCARECQENKIRLGYCEVAALRLSVAALASRSRAPRVVRVEAVEEPTMREICYLDKLIDELAKGKVMGKILRG